MPLPKLQAFKGHDGQMHWRLVDSNGEIILPQQGHRDLTDVQRAVNNIANEFDRLRLKDGKIHIEVEDA